MRGRNRANEYKNRKRSPSYHTWNAMMQRCRNPKNSNYINYGARGIKVSSEWDEFKNFLADMGERPGGMTLDRVDVNSDYSKENCRWADISTQNKNRRKFKPRIPTEEELKKAEASDKFYEETGINI